jgi:AP endonuclease 2
MELRLITFNVNGLRSIRDYYAQSKLNGNLNFSGFLDSFECDIICFQEHKTNTCSKLSHELSFPNGYRAFFAFPRLPKKIGYSGVVTFVKESSPWTPIAWYDGFSGYNDKKRVPLHDSPLLQNSFCEQELAELDSEGRCIITDHFHFMLLNIYFPNDSGSEREEFRTKFYKAIHLRCQDLVKEHGKSLIILGDINIAYHPLDHCEYSSNFKKLQDFTLVQKFFDRRSDDEAAPLLLKEFYANPMRLWLANWLFCQSPGNECGWEDCFRTLNPFESEHEKYTCWNTQMSARGTNYGTRIDTIFTSGPLFRDKSCLVSCRLMAKTMGSDHCPVAAAFEFPDSFKEIHENVLLDSKLLSGNVPKSFGRMDSFFPKRVKVESTEIPVEVSTDDPRTQTNLNDVSVVPKSKSKISDFFSTIQKPKPESVTTDKFISPHDEHKRHQLTSLFNRPQKIPLCAGHSEACQVLKVKKAGPNKGRNFYACARPGGAKTDPNSRCEFFEWVNSNNNKNNKNANNTADDHTSNES